MNFNFFNDIKPEYITVNNDGFNVKCKIYHELECFIREIIPVRKLFRGKKSSVIRMMQKKEKMVNIVFCALKDQNAGQEYG